MKRAGGFLCAALLLLGVFAVGYRAIADGGLPLAETVYAVTLQAPANR